MAAKKTKAKNKPTKSKINFHEIEKKWQKKWQAAKIFEANPDQKNKKFFLTVPYPYVSGPYHIGHGRSYACGDVFARFRRMKGFNVLFPMAFHITGTPVLAVSKIVSSNDKQQMAIYREYISYYEKDKSKIEKVLKSFVEPINVYNFFSKGMRKDFENLGMSIDWRRDFTTGDKIYNKFVEWQYYKFKEKNYLIKAAHPVNFCLSCDNAVGEDDIKDGDTNPVSVNEFTLLKFKFGDSYIVAATLRPETVFGQTNLWVNPNIEYVKVKVGKESWIVSRECAEKLRYQRDEGDKAAVGKVSGTDLIGKYCVAPGIDREIIILPSTFSDPDIGSGIVTSVPSDAPYDLVALRDLQASEAMCKKYGLNWEVVKSIKPIPIIETKEFGDMAAEKVVDEMKIENQTEMEKLEQATQIVYKIGFHTGVLNKNCGEYAGMPVAKAKNAMKDAMIKSGKADIFYETSRKAMCRCGGKVIIAKLRNQWFLDYNAPGWKDLARKCLKNMIIYPEKYRKSFEDTFEWLDKRPCARKRGLGTRLPFDKEWIIESLSDSTIYMAFYTIAHLIKKNKINPTQLTPEVFDFAFLGVGNAKDISRKTKISEAALTNMKKEFDYWYPVDQRHTAIMHISNHLSFFIFHHAGIFPENKWPRIMTLIEPVIVEGVKMGKSKKNVIPLVYVSEKYGADLFRLHMMQAAEFGVKIDWRDNEVNATKKQLERFYKFASVNIIGAKSGKRQLKLSSYSGAVLSNFLSKLEVATKYLENFELKKYIQIILYDVMNDLSEYVNRADKKEVKQVLPEIFSKWIVALSPVIPHLCEEFWHKLGNKTFVSLEKWPDVDEKKIDKALVDLENNFQKTLSDLTQVVKLAGQKKNAYLYFVTDKEMKYFVESQKYAEQQFGFKVHAFLVSDKNKHDPQNKAAKAKYGKPGIYLE